MLPLSPVQEKMKGDRIREEFFRMIASSNESVIPLVQKKIQPIKIMCCDFYQNPQTVSELIKVADLTRIQNPVKHIR